MLLKKIILTVLLFAPILLWSQLGNSRRVPSYFGVYGKAVIPGCLTGSSILTVSKDGISNTLTQELGYSFGASVRAGITKLIALETGINFTQRNFNINISSLIKDIIKSILYYNKDINQQQINDIINSASEFEYRLSKGRRDIIHIEAFILNIMNVFK